MLNEARPFAAAIRRNVPLTPAGRLGLCLLFVLLCGGARGGEPATCALGPDGRALAWVQGRELTVGRLDLAAKRVVPESIVDLPEGYDLVPGARICWPAGERLLLILCKGPVNSLWSFSNGKWARLMEPPVSIRAFVARPKSGLVMYQSWHEAQPDLFFMEMAESDARGTFLTNDTQLEDLVSFSADGRWMLYVTRHLAGGNALALFDWRTFRTAVLRENLAAVARASLGPDGRTILFQDARGLWRVDLDGDRQVADQSRADRCHGLLERTNLFRAGCLREMDLLGIAWQGGVPVVFVRRAGVFALDDDRWRKYRLSGPISLQLSPAATLESRGRAGLFLLDYAPAKPRQMPVVVHWSAPDDAPTLVGASWPRLDGKPSLFEGGRSLDTPRLDNLAVAIKKRTQWEGIAAVRQIILTGDEDELMLACGRLGVRHRDPVWQRRLEAICAFWLALECRGEPLRPVEREALLNAALHRIVRAGDYGNPDHWQELFEIVKQSCGFSEKTLTGLLADESRRRMLRFGFGALTRQECRTGEVTASLDAWVRFTNPRRAERLGLARAAVSALDGDWDHREATLIVLRELDQATPYASGDLLALGLQDWFSVIETRIVMRGELGHLPPWLDARLQGVAERLAKAGEAGQRDLRLVSMLAAWRPDGVATSAKVSLKAGDRLGALAGNLLVASFYHHRGETSKAIPAYREVCKMTDHRFAGDVLDLLQGEGERVRNRAWRWMDCEESARTGPWRPARSTVGGLEALHGLAPNFGGYVNRLQDDFALASRPTQGVAAFRRLVEYYSDTVAGDAGRLRLADLDYPRFATEWLGQIARDRVDSRFYEMALVRMALCAKEAHNCGTLRYTLSHLVDRWSHRNQKKILKKMLLTTGQWQGEKVKEIAKTR